MKIGDFEVDEPIPEPRETHALVTVRPWVDVGRAGRHALIRIERHVNATEIARIERPGRFYDFSRYRPRMMNVGAERRITIPNTTVLHARREDGPDFLFLHLLEPHIFGEDFVDSVVELLKHFNVTKYTQVGSVSDAVPHTRPLLLTGFVSEDAASRYGIKKSQYQGPTSITTLIGQEAAKTGIETLVFLVRLPHYAQLDEDYSGVSRILEVLCPMYDLPDVLIDAERGRRQYQQIDSALTRNPQAKKLVEQLEASYDAAHKETETETTPLPPEVERFLKEMDERLGEEQGETPND